MLKSKLEKRVEELEKKQLYTIEDVKYIARKYLYTSESNYKEKKQNLINRGFKKIKEEYNNSLYVYIFDKSGIRETWEKEYAQGEF